MGWFVNCCLKSRPSHIFFALGTYLFFLNCVNGKFSSATHRLDEVKRFSRLVGFYCNIFTNYLVEVYKWFLPCLN